MKRLVGILLLLCILWGCSDPVPTETAPPPPTPDVEEDNSPLLKSYSLENCEPLAILPIGQDYLTVEKEWLTLFDYRDASPIARQEIPGLPSPNSGLIWVRGDNVAYYHESSRSIVFLKSNLQQNLQLKMPEDMISSAWLSPDWKTVYYTTQESIRALDISTGASRLLKEQGSAWQSITGLFFNGTALRCEVKQTDGSARVSLISTENGALLQDNSDLAHIVAQGDWCFFASSDACVPQLIFGKADSDPQVLWPKENTIAWWPLPEQGLIVAARKTEDKTVLDCYSMETGRRFAVLYLPEEPNISDISAAESGIIWFRIGDTLYRWDPSAANTLDKHNYATPLYTRENPDTAGLAELTPIIEQLEQRYGIDLIIGADAASVVPLNYTFETEYVPQAYRKVLATLADILSQFPDNFFSLAADRAPEKKLTLVLVRNIFGSTENAGLASAGGIQYWLNANPYIALSLSGQLQQNFYHQLGHVIDSRVLSTSAAFYEWHTVNPPGFQYDKDYLANLNRTDTQYLQDADRWFIDMYSMSFEIEDRSRIFEYASLPGNESYFISPNIQAKLKRICDGIRQSFGLVNNPQQFIWEQYLQR